MDIEQCAATAEFDDFCYEVEHLLARCGFKVEALYADYDKRPYRLQSPGELIFAARKR